MNDLHRTFCLRVQDDDPGYQRMEGMVERPVLYLILTTKDVPIVD